MKVFAVQLPSMPIITLPVGALETNCYLIKSGDEVGIVDPADAGDFIIQKIEDLGTKAVWIVVTHGHFDHVLAVCELALAYNIPVYAPPDDEFLLKRAQESAKHFINIDADPFLISTTPLTKETKLKVGQLEFQVIEAPGHTPGGICLYSQEENALICGDLIFEDGRVGRTDTSYGSREQLRDSITQILKLPAKTVVYPGHGGSFLLENWRKDIF